MTKRMSRIIPALQNYCFVVVSIYLDPRFIPYLAMCGSQSSSEKLYFLGTKYPVKVQQFSKSSTSMMVCGSASGVLLPPFVIYRAERPPLEAWTLNGPRGKPLCDDECCKNGTKYVSTKSGWIDMVTFHVWFSKVFIR